MNSLFARFARSASSIACRRSSRALRDALLELGRVALQLVVQPRVLDRGGRLGGQRLGPVDVRLDERVRLRALERAEADHLPAGA